MRRRLVVAPILKNVSVAAALTACPLVAQATSVQTVFSAENALYGAGYNVGQADGWIDDSFRAAVKQYQADHGELSATGELDGPTLAALGIAGGRSELVGDNVVESRNAARKELGLMAANIASPSVAATRSAPEPEQPAVKPESAAEPEPVATKVAKVSNPAPEPEPQPQKVTQQVPKAAPQTVKQPEPRQVAKAPAQPASSQAQSEPEPTSEPIVIVPSIRSSAKNESQAAAEADPIPEGAVDVASVSNSENTVAATPEQTTSAGTGEGVNSNSSDSDPEPEAPEGNVITKVFYFLFGWIG